MKSQEIKMNRYLLIAFMLIISAGFVHAQSKPDLTKKPDALAAEDFVFPQYKETRLNNGLKAFIVKDDEQPTFSIRLLIPGGSSMDGNKPGTADFLTDMMMKGAGQRTALDIANELDGIGANVSVSASDDYISVTASGLTKHIDKILGIFSDILTKPTFPSKEFDKLVPQKLAALKNMKSQPSAIAGNLANMVIYGPNHPYGKFQTEKSIKSLELKDLQDYYNAVIKPNLASLIYVGDMSDKDAVKILNKYLTDWKQGNVATMEMAPPQPMMQGVYFVNRPGSVQSTVLIVSNAPAEVDSDWETQSLASSIMGGGFGSRLFRTLREKYSYTYSPRASLSSKKFANRFNTLADVRNSVTDSAITVMKDLLMDLVNEPPGEEEMNRIKKFRVGQYLMSFENPGFVASLIQNADFNGISMQRVKTYHTRYLNYSPYEIQKIADKYMNPDRAFIVVVGNPEVKSKLEKFGKVYEFDLDLNPLTGENAKFDKVSLDGEELLDKYAEALGGKEKLNAVSTMTITGNAMLNAGGQQMRGTSIQSYKQGGKYYSKLDMTIFRNDSWCDGQNVWKLEGSDKPKQIEGEELTKEKFEAQMFSDLKLVEAGYKCEVLGKQNGMILMKVSKENSKENKTYFFDANTFLLAKIEEVQNTPRGPMSVTRTFLDYKVINGIKVSTKTELNNQMFTLTIEFEYKFNEPLDDAIFTPNK
jgi:predicted Zn-dependent peptidase